MYSQQELDIHGGNPIHGGVDIHVPFGIQVISPVDGKHINISDLVVINLDDGKELQRIPIDPNTGGWSPPL